MGSLTDRERATEPTRDQAPARRAGGTSVDAGSSPDTALAHLQSTLGNQGMAAAMGGQAPDGTPAPSGPPATTAGDGGTLPGGTSTTPGGAGTPPEGAAAPPGAAAASPADAGPAGTGTASAPPGPRSQPSAGPAGRPPSPQPPGGHAPAGSPGAGPAAPAAGQTGPAGPDAPSNDLIDQELVEHEQWAAARAVVGGTRSVERATFAADEVGAGLIGGGESGFVTGLVASIGVQLLEHGLEFLAGDAIPGVGAVIGGVMSGVALAQGWDRNMAALSHVGEGSGYQEAANDIEGLCAALDIVSNIVNIIAGIVGVVAVAAVAATALSLGALTPLALAAGAIATAIAVAGMVLGLVKTALLPLAAMFRALDAFTSQSDPRQVEAEGRVLEQSGAEVGGALGGLAGGALGGAGTRRAVKAIRGEGEVPTTSPAGEQPSSPSAAPPAGDAEPLVVKGEPMPGGPAGGQTYDPSLIDLPPGEGPPPELDTGGQPATTPPDYAAVDLPPGEGPPPELDTGGQPATTPPDYAAVDLPPGEGPPPELDTGGQPATTPPDYAAVDLPPGEGPVPDLDVPYRHPEQDLPSVMVDEEAAGLRPGEVEQTSGPPGRLPERQSDVDWDDPQVRRALGLDPVTGRPTGAKLSGPGQLETDPAVGQYDPSHPGAAGPFHGALGQMKNGEHAPEAVFEVTQGTKYAVRVGPPGAWAEHVFDTPEEAHAYAARLAATGERQIRVVSAVPHHWARDGSGKVGPGNPVDAVRVLEVPSGTPSIRSVVAPQPEGEPGPGRPAVYPGGGPQTQLPKELFPRPPAGQSESPALHGPAYPIGDRESGWARLQHWPGLGRAEDLDRQAVRMAAATQVPRNAAFGARAAGLVNHWQNRPGTGATVTAPVDPNYRPPPGTEAEIQRMTSDAHRLRHAQAQAGHRAARAGQVRDEAQAQGARVQVARQHIGDGVTAAQAHIGQVSQREQAADQSAHQHEESGGKVKSAADHLAGLATLEGLLAGWSHFTGLVLRFSVLLPNSAVSAFQRMNSDSTEFMLKLAGIKRTVAGQQAQQPVQAAQIAQTRDRLTATSTRATGTHQQFTQAQQRGAGLAQVNHEHVAYAERERSHASASAAQAGTAATTIEAQRQARIQQMTEWATEHKAARQRAVDEVCRQMEARGLRVTQRPQR